VTDSGAPPVPGGRQRGRRSRDYSAALSPEHYAEQVLAILYHPHYSLLVRIAALLTGDTTAAERMVEDAFVSVQHARRHLRDQDDALSYLRRFVVSSARSQRAASPGLLSRPHGPAAPQPAHGTPEALLVATLRRLPGPQCEALMLKYYAEWPDAQIADAMGISRRALTAHLRRGMSALQAGGASSGGLRDDLAW